MGTAYYALLGTIVATVLCTLVAAMLSRKRRYASLTVSVANYMRKTHLECYDLLQEHEESFTKRNKAFLIDYYYDVDLLRNIDPRSWKKPQDIDIGLLHSLFHKGDSCLTALAEEMYKDRITGKAHGRIWKHYWKLRVLMHVLPQAMPAGELFDEEGEPYYYQSLKNADA